MYFGHCSFKIRKLYYVMDLSFASLIPSTVACNASKQVNTFNI